MKRPELKNFKVKKTEVEWGKYSNSLESYIDYLESKITLLQGELNRPEEEKSLGKLFEDMESLFEDFKKETNKFYPKEYPSSEYNENRD